MATKAKGKIVKVTGNTSGHGFQIGEKITVTANSQSGCGVGYYNGVGSTGMRYGIYKADFVETPLTSDEIKKTIDSLQNKFKGIQNEIDYWVNALEFMDENKLDKFDETEFKTYKDVPKINWKKIDIKNIKKVEYKKVERPDIDPFYEDDWGYEEKLEESLSILDTLGEIPIRINTQEDYWKLMEELELLGYTWNGDSPTSRNYFPKYPDEFCIYLELNKKLSYCYYRWFIEEGYKVIDYKEIDFNKKFIKTERTDVDPFYEDDWGYEEIN